jgi:hypothetical protein
MFKSKIFLKAMLIVTGVIVIYTLAITIFAIPKIDDSIQNLEEKNAKGALSKVVTITKNVHRDLESYQKTALFRYKDELKKLTHTTWTILRAKHEQSKPQNIGNILKIQGDEFKENLTKYYEDNKNSMSKKF